MEKFIKQISIGAGKITLKYFGEVFKIYDTKAHALDVVTKADLAANKYLIDAIKKKYPKHGIISEETGEYNAQAEYVWIIDPIDGTLNFSKGIPLYMVMVTLMVNSVIQLACLYDPVHKDLYFAQRNKGAFLNGIKIHCSPLNTLRDSVGSMNSRFSPVHLKRLQRLVKNFPENKLSARGIWSMAVIAAYQSTGRQDWVITHGGKFWDYAGTTLIMQEAGCKVTNYEGQPWKRGDETLVAANPTLHKQLIKALN